jgi:hypothetical protein
MDTINKARRYPAGHPMREYYDEQYTKQKQMHDKARNRRVNEMLDIEFDYDENAMIEVQKGINPYRKKGK